MTAISLKLPDELAELSATVADKLGISRTELIRNALRHEIRQIQARLEKEAMANALQAMKQDPEYIHEAELLDQAIADTLPQDPDNWWEA